MPGPIEDFFFRRPAKEKSELFNAQSLIMDGTITPEKLAPEMFQAPAESGPQDLRAPEYTSESLQDLGTSTSKEVAKADHSHYFTHPHRDETQVSGEDLDDPDPVTDISDAQQPESTVYNDRVVTWTIDDAGLGHTPGRFIVHAEYSEDGGTTYSEPEFIGFTEPGVDQLFYRARSRWNFDPNFTPTTTARYSVISVHNNRTTRHKIPRAGYDGKIHEGYLPTDKLGSKAWKQPVRLATAAALPAYTRSGNIITASANGALSVDGVAVAPLDRLLVKDGAAGADNGLYEVTATGDAGSPYVLTRTQDADFDPDIEAGAAVVITAGSTLADTAWVLSTNDPIVINTTALTFTQLGGGGDHGALSGLSDDDHTQYALLAGRSGGQTLKGDTAVGGDLELQSTAHATRGVVKVVDSLNAQKSLILSNAVTDTLTGDVDDYSPSGIDDAAALRLDASGGSFNITGIDDPPVPYYGKILLIFNVGGSNNITLVHLSGSSGAVNQMNLGGTDIVLGPGDGAVLWYDGASTVWRCPAKR